MRAVAGQKQRGVVLIISLIMLLAVTLMVVTASNVVRTNLQIVNNIESREQARTAAVSAIEEAISSDRFTSSPGAVFDVSCEQANRKCYDFNADGVTDVRVDLAEPSCVSVIPKKNSELDVFASPKLATCFLPKVVYSMCAGSIWEFEATATDAVTGAEVTVRQGVSILTTLNKIDSACPA